MKKIIKLSIEENQLKIERFVDIMVLDPHNNDVGDEIRFRGYGFGSFLLNISPAEIDYNQEVLDFLKRKIGCTYSSMGDLFGFSFVENKQAVNPVFQPPRITYGSLEKELLVPQADCTIDRKIFNQLQEYLESSQ